MDLPDLKVAASNSFGLAPGLRDFQALGGLGFGAYGFRDLGFRGLGFRD